MSPGGSPTAHSRRAPGAEAQALPPATRGASPRVSCVLMDAIRDRASRRPFHSGCSVSRMRDRAQGRLLSLPYHLRDLPKSIMTVSRGTHEVGTEDETVQPRPSINL